MTNEQLAKFIKIANILSIATKDDEQNLIALKQALTDNDFKHCGVSVEIMINEMTDLGMDEQQATYWKSLGLLHLPYAPSDIKKTS
jgi:hypothetical protein